jgi:hypothetical protein
VLFSSRRAAIFSSSAAKSACSLPESCFPSALRGGFFLRESPGKLLLRETGILERPRGRGLLHIQRGKLFSRLLPEGKARLAASF